jgi:hypothetical protein
VRGKTGNLFVSRDSQNRELFRISITELEEIAERTGVNLLLLGCTTQPGLTHGVQRHVGIPVDIDALRVAEQLTSAIGNAVNWADFLEKLSAPDLPLIAGKDFLASEGSSNVSADAIIVRKDGADNGSEHLRLIARLWFRFRCGYLSVCGE